MTKNRVNVPDDIILALAGDRFKTEMPERISFDAAKLSEIQYELKPVEKLNLFEAVADYLNMGIVESFKDAKLQSFYSALIEEICKDADEFNLRRIKNEYARVCMKAKRNNTGAEKFNEWFLRWLEE